MVVERQFQLGMNLGLPSLSFSVVLKLPASGAEEGGLGAVDGFAVDARATCPSGADARPPARGQRPWSRADVEEIVAALAGDVDEVAQQRFGGLEVGVVGLVAPGVVHGHAGFPVAAGIALRRDVLLGGFGVALVASAEAVVPDEVGMLVEQGDDLAGERGRHVWRWGIEPDDDGKVAVVGEQLLDLGDGLGVEVSGEVAVLGRVPVMVGEIVIAVL